MSVGVMKDYKLKLRNLRSSQTVMGTADDFFSFFIVWARSDASCLLFLQAHRETDRFFAASGVQLA